MPKPAGTGFPMFGDEVEIVPYQDGPYLVRGPATLRDQDGRGIDAGRRTIALCRCGKSRMRPFCDGTHQLVRFKAPSGPEQDGRAASDSGPVAANVTPLRRRSRTTVPIQTELQESAGNKRDLTATDDPIMHAVALLSAARVLLATSAESPAGSEDPDWRIPCSCLIRGTIAALVEPSGAAGRGVPEVIEQLSALAARLEAQGGHA